MDVSVPQKVRKVLRCCVLSMAVSLLVTLLLVGTCCTPDDLMTFLTTQEWELQEFQSAGLTVKLLGKATDGGWGHYIADAYVYDRDYRLLAKPVTIADIGSA